MKEVKYGGGTTASHGFWQGFHLYNGNAKKNFLFSIADDSIALEELNGDEAIPIWRISAK